MIQRAQALLDRIGQPLRGDRMPNVDGEWYDGVLAILRELTSLPAAEPALYDPEHYPEGAARADAYLAEHPPAPEPTVGAEELAQQVRAAASMDFSEVAGWPVQAQSAIEIRHAMLRAALPFLERAAGKREEKP